MINDIKKISQNLRAKKFPESTDILAKTSEISKIQLTVRIIKNEWGRTLSCAPTQKIK